MTRDAALAVWTAGKDLHDERTLTSTIKVLSDAGDAEAARRTFDDAMRRGTPIDADCLAVMLRIESVRIDGSSAEERRSSKEAVELYRRVTEKRGVVPDTACANAALGVQPRRKLPRRVGDVASDARGSRRAVAG